MKTALASPAQQLVLVVDDNEHVLELVALILGQAGFPSLQASSLAEALSLWEEFKERIDIALLDFVMPEMSGPELGGAFQAGKPDLKLLYMSGNHPSPGESPIRIEAGENFIRKPFQVRELVDLVKRARREVSSA